MLRGSTEQVCHKGQQQCFYLEKYHIIYHIMWQSTSSNNTTEPDHWQSDQTTYIHQVKKKAVAGARTGISLHFSATQSTSVYIYINTEHVVNQQQFIWLQCNVPESFFYPKEN